MLERQRRSFKCMVQFALDCLQGDDSLWRLETALSIRIALVLIILVGLFWTGT
jgi:hypothetical protein